MNKKVKCPTCNIEVEWIKESEFRPFCSERCRLIDLGDWASEKHAIADQSITNENTPYPIDDESDRKSVV